MASRILDSHGYRVTATSSSVEALSIFQRRPGDFDLVITDMNMPVINGDTLAREMMAIRPEIPVILCTGFSKKIDPEKSREAGIKAFAYKPIVKSDLLKIVRKVLDAEDLARGKK